MSYYYLHISTDFTIAILKKKIDFHFYSYVFLCFYNFLCFILIILIVMYFFVLWYLCHYINLQWEIFGYQAYFIKLFQKSSQPKLINESRKNMKYVILLCLLFIKFIIHYYCFYYYCFSIFEQMNYCMLMNPCIYRRKETYVYHWSVNKWWYKTIRYNKLLAEKCMIYVITHDQGLPICMKDHCWNQFLDFIKKIITFLFMVGFASNFFWSVCLIFLLSIKTIFFWSGVSL